MDFVATQATEAPDASEPAASLLKWYGAFQRDLPWRRESTSYHSWICEVMSQQTTLAVVVPRFLRFIEVLPTVHHLATCDDATLRSLWSGLGYYARARNLRKGALHITEALQGRFPGSSSEWLQVPGVGPYTAAVIASITCKEPIACVDGNVVRVVSRLLALTRAEDVWSVEGQRRIQVHAQTLLESSQRSRTHPGDFNQAMMELGATLCSKHTPKCEVCPLSSSCEARRQRIPLSCPPAKPRKAKKEVSLHALAFVSIDPVEHEGQEELRNTAHVLFVDRGRGFLKGTRGLPLAHQEELDSFAATQPWPLEFGKTSAAAFSHTITHHALSVVTHVCVVPPKGSLPSPAFSRRDVENFAVRTLGAHHCTWLPVRDVPSALSTSLDTKAWSALSLRTTWQREACQNP
ncbi:MAG: A/G-specific adenine glycosylase [Silvanigrellales bacterium]|nr:A/G-specific adenine glycosylase [Silvanigrellales bacterium]